MIRALLVLGLLMAGVASAEDFSATVARVDGSIGRVIAERADGHGISLGSGFVVAHNPDGSIAMITNRHVIAGSDTTAVGFLQGGEVALYEARRVQVSRELDLALLELVHLEGPDRPPPVIAIAEATVRKAQSVAAIGFPGVSDERVVEADDQALFESTFTLGTVSKVFTGAWERDTGPLEVVQHSASINPGSSGGPLIDVCGNVVGVNTQRAVDTGHGAPAGTFWASSSAAVIAFLDSAGVAYSRAAPCVATGGEAATGPVAARSSLLLPLAVLAGCGFLAAGLVIWSRTGQPMPPSRAAVPSRASAAGVEIEVAGWQGVLRHAVSPDRLGAGLTVGRGERAGLRLDDAQLSREHMRLDLRARRLTVTDLGSTNGTRVDGRRLRPHEAVPINSASTIEAGTLSLRVHQRSQGAPSVGAGGKR